MPVSLGTDGIVTGWGDCVIPDLNLVVWAVSLESYVYDYNTPNTTWGLSFAVGILHFLFDRNYPSMKNESSPCINGMAVRNIKMEPHGHQTPICWALRRDGNRKRARIIVMNKKIYSPRHATVWFVQSIGECTWHIDGSIHRTTLNLGRGGKSSNLGL